ncbi:MAG: hypothetical protein JXQ75_00160 [Phycisphaerae bacterium]|nr:hypothetical protein [Phycisphaerae bacterium]
MRSNQRLPIRVSGEHAGPSRPARHRRGRAAWVLLVAYTAVLVGRALLHNGGGDVRYVPIWELQDSRWLATWIGGLFLGGVYEVAWFIPVGSLAALAAASKSRRRWWAPALAGAVALAVVAAETGPYWRPANAAGLVLPTLGALFGVWAGATWLRGRRARLWLLPKIALLVLAVTLCLGLALWLSVEEKPLPFEAAAVTSAKKRELVHLIRSKSPRSLGDGQTHTLRLTEDDVNVLLAWGLSLGAADRKARVGLAPDGASLAASMGVRLGGKTRYVNLQLTGDVAVKEGNLSLRVDRCRLGNVEVPSWLVKLWCPMVASAVNRDRRARPFLDAVEAIAIGSDWIEARYTRVDLPPGFREDLLGPAGARQETLASTRVQVEHLLQVVGRPPTGERPTFGMCFERAFALARERSVERNPVTENRAAIFALAVLLGHPRVEEFLGPVLPERASPVALWMLRNVELRGRLDWTKHFWVSAALMLLSDTIVSDAAGLLKEELDADVGGSGFSFADLLADRAGTTFALRATHDEMAARAMQDRLARGFDVDDFFPDAADLPEGIPDAQSQAQYGGVGGEAYLRLIEEIERRVSTCAAYR